MTRPSQDYLDGYFDAVQEVRKMLGGTYDDEVEREAVAMRLEDLLIERGVVHPVDLPGRCPS